MKKNKIYIIVISVLVLIGVVAFWFYRQDITHHGRLYPNRSKMCYQLAIDYLRNIKNDPAYTEDKWNLVVNIETEITNLCQLELTEEAAGNYNPKALEKYKNKSLAEELEECLPKSDMASKEKCDELISQITNFEECVDAGFPVMESYPERCNIPNSRSFTASYELFL